MKITDIICLISESSLIKILILEIKDEYNNISLWIGGGSSRSILLYFGLQDQCFYKLLKLMLIFYDYVFYFFILRGLWSFVSKRKHLLSTLLRLEFIVLRLFFYIFCVFISYFELYFLMYFLTFGVCEGALGLGILVSMIRRHGNDYFSSFSILQC